jgi:hypothetical protein
MTGILSLGVLIVALGACGGRVIEQPSPGSAGSDPTDGNASGAGSPSEPSSSGNGSLPKHELGDCKPGFSPSQQPSRACSWVIENGQCFDTQDEACACICGSENNVCWSAFPKPGVPTIAHCD